MRIWHFLTAFRCPFCLRVLGSKSHETLELIKDETAYLQERFDLIRKREELLDKEKEAILGKDGSEVKRAVLLKSMQAKWEAEKKKLDADRVHIMTSTYGVQFSLVQRIEEIEKVIINIKKKPATSPNQNLLTEYNGRFEELKHIIRIIDEYKD